MQLVNMEQTCAASDISSNTRSLPEIVSQISPKVPLSSVNPAARASSKDLDPFRRPIWKQKAAACCSDRNRAEQKYIQKEAEYMIHNCHVQVAQNEEW
jgi:hypothetical protein